MKIAIIFPRFSGPYGGEKILIKTSNELVRRGHKVVIYVYEYNQICGRHLHASICVVKCHALKFYQHNLDTFLAYLVMPWVASKVRGKYDLILGMTWQSAFALWWIKKLRKHFRGTPLLYHCFEPPRFLYDLQTVTGNSRIARIISPFIKKLDQMSVKSVDGIIAISDYIQNQIWELYQRKAVKVYPGIEIERFQKYSKSAARQKLNIPAEREVFLSISKLHKRKRLDRALQVFKQRRRSQDSIFYIGGLGPEGDNLKILARKMGLGKVVKFIGMVLDEQTAQYMAACDYFVFTALNEPFGIAPLEAKVAGAKVIPKERPYPILSWQESVRKMEKLFSKLVMSGK